MKKLIRNTIYTAIITQQLFMIVVIYLAFSNFQLINNENPQPVETPVMVQDNFPVRDVEELTIASDNKEFNLLFKDLTN